jgi:hypothetical protein
MTQAARRPWKPVIPKLGVPAAPGKIRRGMAVF